jgi:hypothetical protein
VVRAQGRIQTERQRAIEAENDLEKSKLRLARAIGLPVIEGSEDRVFALPCPKLSGTICTIFGERPSVCSRYKCQVLTDYQDGRLTANEAGQIVEQAKGHLAALVDAMPPAMSIHQARSLAGSASGTDAELPPGERETHNRVRLLATAMQLYLDRHFRLAKEGKALTMQPLETKK